MADVLPFAGTRFSVKEKGIDIAKVVAPPFDVISEEQQQELFDRDPCNIVRLTAGREAPGDDEQNNRYYRAAEQYRTWKNEGVLVDEQRKCFYVYQHEFSLPGDKKRYQRTGFFALVKLQDFRSGKIRAHEMTFPAPKLDRLRLLKATNVNLEPVFCLYRDGESVIRPILEETIKGKPQDVIETADGDVHRIWPIHRKDPILAINQAMKKQRLYIADGHHRYEAALQYRDEMRDFTGRRDGRQPYDFILMCLNDVADEAIHTAASHRILARDLGADVDLDEVVEDLEEYFDVKPFKVDLRDTEKACAAIRKSLEGGGKKGPTGTRFVMLLPGGRTYELKLRKGVDYDEMIDEEFMSEFVKQQDITILHKFVIARGWIGNPEVELDDDDITYVHSIEATVELMRKRKGCVAFVLNPMDKDRVLEIAENGELLPHNSTYFYPKIQSGFVLRDLQVGFG